MRIDKEELAKAVTQAKAAGRYAISSKRLTGRFQLSTQNVTQRKETKMSDATNHSATPNSSHGTHATKLVYHGMIMYMEMHREDFHLESARIKIRAEQEDRFGMGEATLPIPAELYEPLSKTGQTVKITVEFTVPQEGA